jgi:hypothetical protein
MKRRCAAGRHDEPAIRRTREGRDGAFDLASVAIRSKGCLSNRTALAIVFKLVEAAQKSWRRLDGHNQLPKLVLGVKFTNGLEVVGKPTNHQPTIAAARPIRPSPKIGDSSAPDSIT